MTGNTVVVQNGRTKTLLTLMLLLAGCATAPEQTKDTEVIETLWNMGCDIDSYAKSERMKSVVVKCK